MVIRTLSRVVRSLKMSEGWREKHRSHPYMYDEYCAKAKFDELPPGPDIRVQLEKQAREADQSVRHGSYRHRSTARESGAYILSAKSSVATNKAPLLPPPTSLFLDSPCGELHQYRVAPSCRRAFFVDADAGPPQDYCHSSRRVPAPNIQFVMCSARAQRLSPCLQVLEGLEVPGWKSPDGGVAPAGVLGRCRRRHGRSERR